MVREKIVNGLAQHDELYRVNREARDLLDAFLDDYGSPPSPLEGSGLGVHYNVIMSSSVFGPSSAQRSDAEFVRPEYKEFDDRCQELGPSFLLGERYQLGNGATLTRGDEKVPYAKQAVLTNVGVNWSALVNAMGRPLPGAPRIADGDILLACTALSSPAPRHEADVRSRRSSRLSGTQKLMRSPTTKSSRSIHSQGSRS